MPPQSVNSISTPSPAVDDGQCAINFWKKRFDKRHPTSHPVIATLDIEYNELVQSWKTFQEKLPSEDRVKFQERPQTSRDVLEVVEGVQAVWVSSPHRRVFSRSMSLCETFLSTLDSHATAFTTFPDSQFYSSLFNSVLQSIIKASASYPRIMEGVMTVLTKLNITIASLVKCRSSLSTKDMAPSFATFYYLTFFLLNEMMDWYVRRLKCRLLKSLNQDMYLDLRGLVCSIQSSARESLRDTDAMDLDQSDYEQKRPIIQHTHLHQWEEARLSQIGQRHNDRRSAAQNAWIRRLIWEIWYDDEERIKMREKGDALLLQMFELASRRLRPVSQQNSGIACLTTNTVQDPDVVMVQTLEGPKHKYNRLELQAASAHLQDYFDNDDQISDFETDIEVIAEDSVIESLRQWILDPRSRIIVVGGSPITAFPSPVALISASYTNLAREVRLPVISHFCSLPTREKDGMTLFEQGLIALVYSVIRQLVDYLPPILTGTSSSNLKAERFSPLKGTLSSWQEVLSLIDTLLYYAPPLLVCIIDGLDKLQDSSTDIYIRSFVRTLMAHTKHQTVQMPDGYQTQSVLLKVLFTVAGRPNSLIETLSENTLILSKSNQSDQGTNSEPLNPDVGAVMMNA